MPVLRLSVRVCTRRLAMEVIPSLGVGDGTTHATRKF
jgi:hypothetical protein